MSDPIDNELRSLMAKMVDASPAAPEFDELFERAAAANESALTTVTADNTTAAVAPAGNPVVLNGSSQPEAPTADDFAPNSRPRANRVPWWQRLLAGVGIAGIAAGGAYGFAAITADDGGADSAEQAAQVFMEALDDEDFIGAAETLDPGERDLALTYMPTYLAELDRMGLVNEEADLNNVQGGDIKADPDDLIFSETVLTNNRSRVDVSGFSYEVSAADLPLSDRASRELDDQGVTDGDIEGAVDETTTIDELPLVAVQRSDGWYVSLAYTAAEFGLDRSDWTREVDITIAPNGASSPENAATAVVEAVLSGEATELIATLDPVEAAVLYDYMPIAFANGVDSSWPLDLNDGIVLLDQEAAGELERLEWTTTGTGERRSVVLAELEFVIESFWSSDDASQRFSYSDGCVQAPGINGRDGEIDGFDSETAKLLSDGEVCADPNAEEGSTERVLADSLESLSMEVVDRDGSWYLAPATTMLEWGLTSMRAVPDDVLDSDTGVTGGILGLPGAFLTGVRSTDGSEAVTTAVDGFEDSGFGFDDPMEPEGRSLTWINDGGDPVTFILCLEGPVAVGDLDRVNSCMDAQAWSDRPLDRTELEECAPISDDAIELGLSTVDAGDEVIFCIAELRLGFDAGSLDDVRANCSFYLDRMANATAIADCLLRDGLIDTDPTDAELAACGNAVEQALVEYDLPATWWGGGVGQCLEDGTSGIYSGDEEIVLDLPE